MSPKSRPLDPASHSAAKRCKTNQRTRLERFRKNDGLERHCFRECLRLPDEEEEELTVWPVLPPDILTAGRCA